MCCVHCQITRLGTAWVLWALPGPVQSFSWMNQTSRGNKIKEKNGTQCHISYSSDSQSVAREPMRLKWCSWDITGHFDCPSLLSCTVEIPRGYMGCDGMEKWESKQIWESLCLLSSHILRFVNVKHCHFPHLYFFIWEKMVAGDNSAGCH